MFVDVYIINKQSDIVSKCGSTISGRGVNKGVLGYASSEYSGKLKVNWCVSWHFYCQPTNAAWEALGLKTEHRRHFKRGNGEGNSL